MSRRPTRRTAARTCDGKRRHTDEAGAIAQRQRLIAAGAHPARIHVYQCRHCSGYHVGHVHGGRR